MGIMLQLRFKHPRKTPNERLWSIITYGINEVTSRT